MRKKSHLSLARYMVRRLDDEQLKKHKLPFYVGSILPDVKPSFLYKRHEMEETFPLVSRCIGKLSDKRRAKKKKSFKFYMDLGQISHYLADYFTFPHNKGYGGNLREHCSYEKKLKQDLRGYLKNGAADKQQWKQEYFGSAGALCNYIVKEHRDYVGDKHDVEDDIHHIVEVNHKAVQGIMQLLKRKTFDAK